MNDNPRTVEGALKWRDIWADSHGFERQPTSDKHALDTLAAEVRRLQAQAKPDTVACAEAAVVRAAEALTSAADEMGVVAGSPRFGNDTPGDLQGYITKEIALYAACAALAQARKESQGE